MLELVLPESFIIISYVCILLWGLLAWSQNWVIFSPNTIIAGKAYQLTNQHPIREEGFMQVMKTS